MVFCPNWSRRLLLRPGDDAAKSAGRNRARGHVLPGRSAVGSVKRLEIRRRSRPGADAGYWTALFSPRDQLHLKAVAVSESMGVAEVVASEMVLVEVSNSFSNARPALRDSAASLVETLREDPFVRIIPQTFEQFESALQLYRQATDKSWSLTDCASFNIMEDEHIRAALTHDRRFAQAGYEALLR